jgi:glutathionylspermidine synthase
MFNYTPSHEEIIARCSVNGEGYGSDARMYAEFDLVGIKELEWAREVVALADEGIHRYKAATETEREALAVKEAREKVFNNAKDRWAKVADELGAANQKLRESTEVLRQEREEREEVSFLQCTMGG